MQILTNDDGMSAADPPEELQIDGQATAHEEEKTVPYGRWYSSKPSGALVIVSLASPRTHERQGPHSKSQGIQVFGEPSRSLSQCTQEPRDN